MSFFKGFAQGFQGSLDRAERERQRQENQKIAKLQGQLLELQINKRQDEQDALGRLTRALDPTNQLVSGTLLDQTLPTTEQIAGLLPGGMSTREAAIQSGRIDPKTSQDILATAPDFLSQLPTTTRDAALQSGRVSQPKSITDAIADLSLGDLLNLPSTTIESLRDIQKLSGTGGTSQIPEGFIQTGVTVDADGEMRRTYGPRVAGARSKTQTRTTPGGITYNVLVEEDTNGNILMDADGNPRIFPILKAQEFEQAGGKVFKQTVSGFPVDSPQGRAILEDIARQKMQSTEAGGMQPNLGLSRTEDAAAQGQAVPGGDNLSEQVFTKLPVDKKQIEVKNLGKYYDVDGNAATVSMFPPGDRTPEKLAAKGFLEATDKELKSLDASREAEKKINLVESLYIKLFPANPRADARPNIGKQGPKLRFPRNKPDDIEGFQLDEQTRYANQQELEEKSSYFSLVKDRIDFLAGAAGTRDARIYYDTMLSTAVGLARALGEVGTMTEGDVARALSLLPFIGLQADEKGDIRITQFRMADDYATGLQKIANAKKQAVETSAVLRFRSKYGNRNMTPSQNNAVNPDIDTSLIDEALNYL